MLLEQVASNDSDGQVRRTVLENIENIKKKPIQGFADYNYTGHYETRSKIQI